jgi:hypothetical protein
MAKLIGTDPNQVPTNADLGSAAYADTQNMPETRLTNQPLSAKFGAEGDVPTDLASTLDFMQISGSTFVQTGSDAQAFIKSNHYWNGTGHGFVNTGRGSTTIRLNENNAGQIWFETATSGGVATSARMIIDENGRIRMPYQASIRMQRVASGVNIPTNVSTSLPFDYTDHAAGITFNTSNNRFTVPVTGKYFISTNSRFNSHPAMNAELGIRINGTTRVYNYIHQTSATYHYFTANLIYEMSAGDYFDVYFYQGSGSTQSLSYNYQGVTAVQAWLMG